MGKEWLYWVVGGSGGNSRSRRRRRRVPEETKETAAMSGGCMCAVFQIFHLHHFHQFPLNQQYQSTSFHLKSSFMDDDEEARRANTSKGIEAPRNSLESNEQAAMDIISMSIGKKEKDDSLIFPVGIQIKTSVSSPRISTIDHHELTSESTSNSPGTKSPNLVARLMGLGLLPLDQYSTNSSPLSISKPQSKSRKDSSILQTRSMSDDDISTGARSLPETPRMSSSRRSDLEHHHRLSLQINKENVHQEFGVSDRLRNGVLRNIIHKERESMSTRIALIDITNNSNKNKIDKSTRRRDENLVLSKKNDSKITYKSKLIGSNSGSDPQRNLNQFKLKTQVSSTPSTDESKKDGSTEKSSVSTSAFSSLKHLHTKACDRVIRNKKEEAFFLRSTVTIKAGGLSENKSKKTPLSGEVLNITGPSPTLLPVKRDPFPHATKLLHKQVEMQSKVSDAISSKKSIQLSYNPSHSYNHTEKIFAANGNIPQAKGDGCAAAFSAGAASEFHNYIQRILKRTGVRDETTPLTLGKWHTPSHPLDPSIFHYLELFQPATAAATGGGCSFLSLCCNRKLIFQLVDELLSEILRPHFGFRPWVPPLQLVDELCKKIQSFPAANCRVLEDIDELIDTDFRKLKLKGCLEEEVEWIMCEIEGEIIEVLVRETVAVMGGRTAEEPRQRQRLVDVMWRDFT